MRRRKQQISERQGTGRIRARSNLAQRAARCDPPRWPGATLPRNTMSCRIGTRTRSLATFFLARTSFPPPSHRITSTAPLRFLYSLRPPPPSSSSYRFLRSPSHRCITPPPLELAKINQITMSQRARIPETARDHHLLLRSFQ